jgi:hypothetical protein
MWAVGGMIVEDQLDRGVGRISGVDKLEEFDEFAAAVAIPDEGMNLTGQQIDAGQQTDGAVALVFMIARTSQAHGALIRRLVVSSSPTSPTTQSCATPVSPRGLKCL